LGGGFFFFFFFLVLHNIIITNELFISLQKTNYRISNMFNRHVTTTKLILKSIYIVFEDK